jgi:hypothetical protein
LEELLNFRHVVKNIYAYELKPERVEELVKLAIALYPKFAKEIGIFTAFLMDVFNQA